MWTQGPPERHRMDEALPRPLAPGAYASVAEWLSRRTVNPKHRRGRTANLPPTVTGSNPVARAINGQGPNPMSLIGRHLSFVNEQASNQEKLARLYETQPWRSEKHKIAANQFRELAKDIANAEKALAATSAYSDGNADRQKSMSLTLDDIEGLPEELLRELSISDSDRVDFLIVSLINEWGGILSLDKILVGIFKKTGEVHKRNVMTSRLYRMRQKGMIFNVPNKAGFYSTKPISEQEVKRIFGQEDADIVDDA